MQKAVRYYFYVAGVLLLTTAIAKLVSANGSARILDNPDPLFSVSFREVFRIVGAIEIFVAILCFSSRRVEMQTGWVAWLATNFSRRFKSLWGSCPSAQTSDGTLSISQSSIND